jgi:hypothetical protein
LVKEQWVVERGPLADPEYLQVTRIEMPAFGAEPELTMAWGTLERATRFGDHDSATKVAAETRAEELRVVSDADL